MQNYTINFKAMGSTINVWLNAETEADSRILLDIPALFERWEDRFSRFRSTSELSQLNAKAGHWQHISLVMGDLITLALKAAETTDGLFNPLILTALEAAGYDHSFSDPSAFVPGKTVASTPIPAADAIDYDDRRHMLRLPAGSRLDLGGIVKGWAAQQAADYLSQVGACLVDAGGDLVGIGAPDEVGGWLVNIPNPLTDEILNIVRLTNAAIATSGSDYRRWTRDGHIYHHLIDPRTGQPAQSDILSATVIAPNAVDAEIWAKASLISGNLPDLPAVFVHQDGAVTVSPKVEAFVHSVSV